MGIRLKRLPEHDINLELCSGTITAEEALRYWQELTPADARVWLTYFYPSADLSGWDVASLPKLKRLVAAQQKVVFGDKQVTPAVVCRSSLSEAFLDFWTAYAASGDMHPSKPMVFSSLEEACDGLGLSDAARAAVEQEIHREDPITPDASQSARYRS